MKNLWIFGLAIILSSGLAQSSEIVIYGGRNAEVYLGCLTCSEYSPESVHNKYGLYGSPYGTNSIFNRYGQYGSRYSDFSPCNPYSNNPPKLVDRRGAFYGYLTLNRYKPNAATSPSIAAWLEQVCNR